MTRLVLVVVLALVAGSARALPEFSVETAASCASCHVQPDYWENPEDPLLRKCTLSCTACHVNPTGGGMRVAAGQYYGRHHLALMGRTSTPQPPYGNAEFTSTPRAPIRYAGIEPFPTVDVGFDWRMLAYYPELEGEDDAVFPMQGDIHLVVRPINPKSVNEGRLTFVVTAGAEGTRRDDVSVTDRAFVKEAWGLYDDFPANAYVKAGRFLPAFGWRFDDHTILTRQSLTFDHERQVLGVEVGVAPNYPFAHLSVYTPNTDAETPRVEESGWGTALSAGWRGLTYQLGGSVMFEQHDAFDDLWVGGHWSANLFDGDHPWKGLRLLPVTYLGEVDLRRTAPDGGDATTALAAMHQLTAHPVDGLRALARYEWIDQNVNLRDDHRHRVVFGLTGHPLPLVEIAAQYRMNLEPEPTVDDDEVLVMLHLYASRGLVQALRR